MIPQGQAVRVYAAAKPTDMRKSYDTLGRIVVETLGRDPLSGELFLFINSRCNRAKVLYWDGTGTVILMKRLEHGKFAAPWKRSLQDAVEMTASELSLFLEGSQLVFMGQLSPTPRRPTKVATRELVIR